MSSEPLIATEVPIGMDAQPQITYDFDMGLLTSILAKPFDAHPMAIAAAPGGLKAAHIRSLLGSLDKISAAFDRSEELMGGNGPAFHAVVYHLAGGADAELRPPPRKGGDKVFSAHMLCDAERDYGKSWGKKQSKLKTAGDTEGLTRHREGNFDLSKLLLPRPDEPPREKRQPRSSNIAASGGGGQPTPGDAELERRAVCRLMLACGTHAHYGMRSPIFKLGGLIEVLTMICEHAGIGTIWLAERPPKELHVLRRQAVLEHRQAHDYRRVAEEALATCEMARKHEGWARAHEMAACETVEARLEAELDKHTTDISRLKVAHAAHISSLDEQLKVLRGEQRAERKEAGLTQLELQKKVKATEQSVVDRLRDQDRELRAECVRLATERDVAAKEMAAAQEMAEQMVTSLDRVRNSSKAKLLETVNEQQAKIKQLSERRKVNQRKLSDANLEAQRVKVAYQQRDEARAAFGEYYVTENGESIFDAADRVPKLEEQLAEQQAQVKQLQAELKDQKAETEKLKLIVEPPKSKFFWSGHYAADVDLTALEVIANLNVSTDRVPRLFVIFARFFGITIPSRVKKVQGPNAAEGTHTYVMRTLLYIPSKTHMKTLPAIGGEIHKIQVGEWLLDDIDDANFCYVSDGANSQQDDIFAQLLFRRNKTTGKLESRALSLCVM